MPGRAKRHRLRATFAGLTMLTAAFALVACRAHGSRARHPSDQPQAAVDVLVFSAEQRWPAPDAVSVVYGFEGWDQERPVFRVESFSDDGGTHESYIRLETNGAESRWSTETAPFRPRSDPDARGRNPLSPGEAIVADGEPASLHGAIHAEGRPPVAFVLHAAGRPPVRIAWPAPAEEARLWRVVLSPAGTRLLIELLTEEETHVLLATLR